MKLTDRGWKEFKIGDLFDIDKVRGLPTENYKCGDVPYITTSSNNNGLTDFISADNKAISKQQTF